MKGVFLMSNLITKPVDVLGSQVMAAKDSEGQIWAGVRWFCQGLDFSKGQIDRQIKIYRMIQY